MTPQPTPAAETEIDARLVRALLAEQHPDLADLALVEVGSGWDNAIYRLGTDLVVRLPRRAFGAALVAHEHRWLPALAPGLPLPVPVPVRVGRAAAGYPWPWSVCRWFPGRAATVEPPADLPGAADLLGGFVAAFHQPAPPAAPINPYRGVPLAERAGSVTTWLDQLDGLVERAAVEAAWAAALAAPAWAGPALWLHGDLHPGNVVVHEGRVTAIIDLGDLTAGDPATDLAVGWMLLPPGARPRLRAAAGPPGRSVDDATWDRARGWALLFALALLASSADNPIFHALGQRTLDAVLADT